MSASGSERVGSEVVLVAAVAENGVIGIDGEMPWYYPADLQHFKQTTTGHPVIMGRLTYESIVANLDGPLPDRTNVVLSTQQLDLADGAVLANGVEEAMEKACEAPGGDTIHIVGGETVYAAFLSRADAMVLTEVPQAPDGDTHFPEFDEDEWTETERQEEGELSFVTYQRD
jgi:dihydrofolate reductase